jgi:hypothetical protein
MPLPCSFFAPIENRDEVDYRRMKKVHVAQDRRPNSHESVRLSFETRSGFEKDAGQGASSLSFSDMQGMIRAPCHDTRACMQAKRKNLPIKMK